MAVCDTGNLNMLDSMLKGLNYLSYAHRRALASGAERGLTCSCCQTASLWVRSLCLSCVILTPDKYGHKLSLVAGASCICVVDKRMPEEMNPSHQTNLTVPRRDSQRGIICRSKTHSA